MNSLPTSPRKTKILDLNWDLPDLPASIPNYIQAVYHQGTIYVGGSLDKESAHTVFTYNMTNTTEPLPSWVPLPAKTPRREFGMAVVKVMLTTLSFVGVYVQLLDAVGGFVCHIAANDHYPLVVMNDDPGRRASSLERREEVFLPLLDSGIKKPILLLFLLY